MTNEEKRKVIESCTKKILEDISWAAPELHEWKIEMRLEELVYQLLDEES